KGEGGDFVAGGRIAPGGALPVNTNGGGLSCCHPGMYGLFTIVENCLQLRGQAGQRQVANAQLAVSHANGGTLSSQATLVLGSGATLRFFSDNQQQITNNNSHTDFLPKNIMGSADPPRRPSH